MLKKMNMGLLGEVVKGIGYETAYRVLSADPVDMANSLMNVKNKFKHEPETVEEAKEEIKAEDIVDEVVSEMDKATEKMEDMISELDKATEKIDEVISEMEETISEIENSTKECEETTETQEKDIDSIVEEMMEGESVLADIEEKAKQEKIDEINKEIDNEEEFDEIDQLINYAHQIEDENLLDDSIDHLLEKNKNVMYGEDVVEQLNDYDDNYEIIEDGDIDTSVMERICNRHEVASNIMREAVCNIYNETEDFEHVNEDLNRISDELDELLDNDQEEVIEGSMDISSIDFQAVSNSMKHSE